MPASANRAGIASTSVSDARSVTPSSTSSTERARSRPACLGKQSGWTLPGLGEEPPVVLVAGASSGIGRAWAEYLATRDWRVFAVARRPEATNGVAGVAARHGRDENLRTVEGGYQVEESSFATRLDVVFSALGG